MTYSQVYLNPKNYKKYQILETLGNMKLIKICNPEYTLDQILQHENMQNKVNNNTQSIDGKLNNIVLQSKCYQSGNTGNTIKSYEYNDIRADFPNCDIIYVVDQRKTILEKLSKKEKVIGIYYFDDLALEFKLYKDTVKLNKHQQSFIDKHISKISKYQNILINCMCRYGKSYLMKYLIQVFNWNACVITTKPNETKDQYDFLQIPYFSVQLLKNEVNQEDKLKQIEQYDILFIDEAQESYMTPLTKEILQLDNFQKIIYLTGTSQKLENYLTDYYLCHYNFGDYLLDEEQNRPKFPKIQFYNEIPDLKELKGKTLIFNRDCRNENELKQFMQQFKDVNVQLQTCNNQTDILIESNNPKIYVLDSQFTTGSTIKQCYQIIIYNKTFSEVDIQSIFRCFNSNNIDIDRKVYFVNLDLMKECLKYIYRQTGKTFISNESMKIITDILCPQMNIHFEDSDFNIDIKKEYAVQLFKQFGRHERIIPVKIDSVNKILKVKNQKQKMILDIVHKLENNIDVIEKEFLIIQRLVVQLSIFAFYGKYDRYRNPFNQDYSAHWFWIQYNKTKDNSLNDIFNSYQYEKKDLKTNENNNLFLNMIFEMYDKANKTKIIKKVFEIISYDNIFQKNILFSRLYQTTQYELKENGEVLTPPKNVIQMLDKFEQLYPGKITDKNFKIIEPCCGKGAFLIELFKRRGSLEGIYFNDINIVNVLYCRTIFQDYIQENQYSNISALEIDYSKYDLVVTNPPYNSKEDNLLYQQFILKYQLIKNIMIIPEQFKKYQLFQDISVHFVYLYYFNNTALFGKHVCISPLFYIYDPQVNNPKIEKYKNKLIQENPFKISTTITTDIKTEQQLKNKQLQGTKCYITGKSNLLKKAKYIRIPQIFKQPYYYIIYGELTTKTLNLMKVYPGEVFSQSFVGIRCYTETQMNELFLEIKNHENEIILMKGGDRHVKPYMQQINVKEPEQQQ